MKIPSQYIKAIGKYLPIETDGLTLYPVKVDEYEDFLIAKPALEFMLQTLPVRYASMPLLAAYYALDYDKVSKGEAPVGLYYRALLLLALSMRLGIGQGINDRIKRFITVCDPKDPSKLKLIRFYINGEELVEITPMQFTKLRTIIAAQNGIELVTESANPELIEAEQDLATRQSAELEVDFYALKATIALWCNCNESDMDEWPILKLLQRQKALQRSINYIICAINEGNGAKWKHGNPNPSLFYDRIKKENDALMPLKDFAGGAGERAIQQQQANSEVN